MQEGYFFINAAGITGGIAISPQDTMVFMI